MEKGITNLMMLVLCVSTMLFFNTKSAFCQYDTPITVEAERYSSVFGEIVRESPEYFSLQRGFGPSEMHLLDTLSSEERLFIESEIDPPAIGIIRDLQQPIVFNLRQIEIPPDGEITTSGGRLSRISDEILVFSTYIKSERADEIRIFFSEGNFPHGVQVNLFSQNDFAFNQIELRGELDEYGFYTRTIFADYVIIQIVIPIESFDDDLHFSITKVVHVDSIYMPEDLPRSCYQDANCPYANEFTYIDNLHNATAQLTFPIGSGYYLCSGGQLNDTRDKDFQPFLLTANHCINTQASAAGLEARFYYWSTYCNSGITNPNYVLVNGSNLIATHNQSDFTLVLLKEKGGNLYLGWTTIAVNNEATLHSVHHPGGMLQQYSRHTNNTSPNFTCTDLSTSTYHYTKTIGGQTEGGSSGGVITNENGYVVGQLYGFCALSDWDICNYDSYYNLWGRFDASFNNNNLQYWLNNGGASVAMSTNPSTTLEFGSQAIGSSTDLNVIVTNTGIIPNYLNLEAGSISISGVNANQFSIIGATSLYLPPGTSGSFKIRFSPTSAGPKTAILNIPHNADNILSPLTISLSGSGAEEICKDCPNFDFAISPQTYWQNHASSHEMYGCKMYRVNVINGKTYTFKTGCGNGATADYDTYLTLFSNSCDSIAYNNDGCEELRSELEWTANYSGFAYLKVRGWTNKYGSYTLAYKFEADPFLIISPTSTNVGVSAGNTSIDISSNISWTVSESCDWLSCNPTNGSGNGTITINYDANTTTQQRSCIITVSGSGINRTFTLTQQAATAYITLTPVSQTVDAVAGSTDFSISSNVSWAVFESCDWLSCNPTNGSGNGTITINYDANTTTQQRSCAVTVSGSGINRIFTLTQQSATAYITLTPESQTVDAVAGSTDFSISSNVSWSVSESCDWLSCNPTNGSGNGTITINYDANTTTRQRSCAVTVSGSGINRIFTLTQQSATTYITLTPESQTVDAVAGSTDFAVNSNVSWTVSESCDWLICSPTSGTENDIIIADYQENTDFLTRECEITVGNNELSSIFTLIQQGAVPYLIVDPESITVDAEAGLTTFIISSNISWSITHECDWLSCFPGSGTNTDTIIVEYQEYTDTQQRSCVIRIDGSELSTYFMVTQEPSFNYFLDVIPNELTLDPFAGSVNELAIISNDLWTIVNQTEWLSVEPTQGANSQIILFTATEENKTGTERNSDVIVVGIQTGFKSVTVTQLPYIGLDDITTTSAFNIHPNPTKATMTITSDCVQYIELNIYSQIGEQVLSLKNVVNHQVVDVSFLSPGLYVLEIQCNTFRSVQKLIKL
ncbi:MAG: choice-of-anchor D domain-containing protein [Bacteroidales bacterium]|nr:choice-of-anchor D domain-containing protein [Bacteroidales bacterium]